MSLAAFFIKAEDGRIFDKDNYKIVNGWIVDEKGFLVTIAESPDKGWNPPEKEFHKK